MKASRKCFEVIKHFESLHDGDLSMIGLQPKMCPAGYWTEGYGALVLDASGRKIKGQANKEKAYQYSKIKTIAQAEAALSSDVKIRENMINGLRLNLTQGQFDALVSFVYNIGMGNLQSSTLLKIIKETPTSPQIRSEFAKWKYADGRVQKGLVLRRKAEADLYFS